MAISMGQTIKFPVIFQDTSNSFKQIIQNAQNELSKLKPGTAIYKSIVDQISRASKLINNYDLQVELGIDSSKDVERFEKNLQKIDTVIQGIQRNFGRVSFKDLNVESFGEAGEELQNLSKQLAQVKQRFTELSKIPIKKIFEGDLSSLQVFSDSQLKSGGLKVFESMGDQLEIAKIKLQQTEVELNKTKSEANDLEQSFQQASGSIDLFAERMAEIRRNEDTVDSLRNSIKNQLGDLWDSKNKIWSSKNSVKQLLQAVGLDDDTIKGIFAQEAAKQLNAAKEEVNRLTAATFKAAVKGEKYGLRAAASQKARQLESDMLLAKERAASYEQQKATEQANIDNLARVYGELENRLRQLGVFEARQQIDDLSARIVDLEDYIVKGGPSITAEGGPDLTAAIREMDKRAIDKEASERFKNNLKESVSHWMSAQQIINLVKDGIRQAYQDIQGLDKAMTNIAVVTDMSISDLWGKINDYMAIAQQYGVTTQGVYEVSQIYYQQGLSTSEVMEATTETLKMARIAGMQYADAADAMTVAIRAFKMEMSDAATVTDVYSKVAAITASDSEELAIAMSKTASSADSVGSSFENTTSMLAVMIETTRESAQNLGSALKSIISR